jgi:hypothetical protein
MFRTATGFKAQYHYLTLLVASDFDEWRIILHGPGVCIQGGRQFTEAKAKEHARAVAMNYVHDEKHENLLVVENLDWQPFTPGEFLNWRS